jgi:WD40 repeat protein
MTGGITASPDGRWFATGNWKGTNVMVWEMATCHPVHELVVKGSAAVLFSPDGQWLVTGSEDEYRLWKVGSWEPGRKFPRDRAGDMFGRMAFSPNGRILAVLRGRNTDVRLIAIPGGQELATLDTGPPLCFSGDGNLLATAGDDLRTVFVWDLLLIRKRLAALNLDW